MRKNCSGKRRKKDRGGKREITERERVRKKRKKT
jgi:hypothetical protein